MQSSAKYYYNFDLLIIMICFNSTYSYDPNGNLRNLSRKDGGADMGDLGYTYNTSTNQLNRIREFASSTAGTNDLENQSTNNYEYDASGNLNKDVSENIFRIEWTPDGKLKTIHKGMNGAPNSQTINYTYDAMGQRVMKAVTTMGQTPNTKQTIYARDANGQVMAIYEREFNPLADNNPHPRLEFEVEITVGDCSTIVEIESDEYHWNMDENGIILDGTMPVGVLCGELMLQYFAELGMDIEVDELKNQDITKDFLSWFGKNYADIKKLKFADGSWYNVNQGVTLKDINNNDVPATITKIKPKITFGNPSMLPKLAEWHVYGNGEQGRFLTKYPEELNPTYYGTEVTDDVKEGRFKRQLGKKAYELKDHLGNVRTTFSDIKMPKTPFNNTYEVDLLSKSEYYPYGMVIDELSYNIGNNRYGFGGTHEMDNEVKGGVGNHLSFGDFGYDTRAARRFNIDPIDQIFISNYAVFGNNPIFFRDPTGYSYCETCEDVEPHSYGNEEPQNNTGIDFQNPSISNQEPLIQNPIFDMMNQNRIWEQVLIRNGGNIPYNQSFADGVMDGIKEKNRLDTRQKLLIMQNNFRKAAELIPPYSLEITEGILIASEKDLPYIYKPSSKFITAFSLLNIGFKFGKIDYSNLQFSRNFNVFVDALTDFGIFVTPYVLNFIAIAELTTPYAFGLSMFLSLSKEWIVYENNSKPQYLFTPTRGNLDSNNYFPTDATQTYQWRSTNE